MQIRKRQRPVTGDRITQRALPFPFLAFCTSVENAPRRGAGLILTSSTAKRSPFPSKGRTMCPLRGRKWQCQAPGLAPHPPLHGPPSAQGTASHVLQGEGINAASNAERLTMSGSAATLRTPRFGRRASIMLSGLRSPVSSPHSSLTNPLSLL